MRKFIDEWSKPNCERLNSECWPMLGTSHDQHLNFSFQFKILS